MVGQNNLKQIFKQQIDMGAFPRFSLLVGPHGSGKKLMCDYLARQLGATECRYDTSVNSIREMIAESYKVATKVLYVLPDADKMSPQAKNALLKVAEEPPQNAYIIMTLEDINNTLGTIRSRAFTYNMDPYTVNELLGCVDSSVFEPVSDVMKDMIINICTTPGDVVELISTDMEAFYDYVNLTVDNIASVSGSNALKISGRLQFSDSEKDKFNPKLFLRAFSSVCAKHISDTSHTLDILKYADGIQITDRYIRDLSLNGVNKHNTIDMWILDIRRAWR